MSNQIQCSNCGGFKVDSLDSRGKSAEGVLCLVFLAAAAIGALFLINVGGVAILLAVPVGLVALLYLLPMTLDAFGKAGNAIKHSCQLCGYSWSVRPGDPAPPVQVRPDLIKKGAEHLERQRRLRD